MRISVLSLSCLLGLAALSSAQDTPAKLVVVQGSSTAVGVGASAIDRSWVALFAQLVAPQGFAIRNVSVSGIGTTAALARFNADVAPLRPAYVVLATSILNDNFGLDNPEQAARNYLANVRTLAARARQIGARPLVIGPYPNAAWDARRVALLRDLYEQLEADGLLFWNFFDGLASADGQGRWYPGIAPDGTHPNDLGHALLLDAIPSGTFLWLDAQLAAAEPATGGSWAFTPGPDVPSTPPLEIALDRPAANWTWCAWYRASFTAHPWVLASVDANFLRFQMSSDSLEVVSNSGSLWEYAPDNVKPEWRHFCASYQGLSGALLLYRNGELIASRRDIQPPMARASRFHFGGMEGHPAFTFTAGNLAAVVVYRNVLDAAQLRRIYEGAKPAPRSLEAWLPLTHSPRVEPLNLAPTRGAVKAAPGLFSFADESPRPPAP